MILKYQSTLNDDSLRFAHPKLTFESYSLVSNPRIRIRVIYISNKVTLTLTVKYRYLVDYLIVKNLVSLSLNLNKDRSVI
jgi:hypothetical protein